LLKIAGNDREGVQKTGHTKMMEQPQEQLDYFTVLLFNTILQLF